MKRSTTGLCGVLAIDKPAGMTSHDVVDAVRRATGERRVGHAGTLDPAATGLMLIGVGAATRLSRYLTGHDKSYRARIVFGASTDTDDATGRVTGGSATQLPACAPELPADAQAACATLVGSFEQLPPAYSAIKKNGVAAYKAAREGSALELEARTVTVHEARLEATGSVETQLEGLAAGTRLPYWDVFVRVSKGTYIRSIARDLGTRFGCGAHLGSLRRVSVADYGIERAVSLAALEQAAGSGRDLPWCDPAALLGFPVLQLDERQADDVSHGRALAAVADAPEVSCVAHDKLLAVYKCAGGQLRPATVIPGGVAGVC